MSVVAEKCSCSLCELYQGIPKVTFAGRKMVKTDEIQKGWRQSMDLIREQSKIIHTSREIIAEYQDHLAVCFTKSIDECIICRDLFSSLESCLMAGSDQTTKMSKQELAIQQNLRELFKTDKLCISIFFDNPQLSKTVSTQEGMEVILETFVTKTMVKILFGRIVYSGEYDPTIPCVQPSKMRGGDVIVAEVVELISADLSKFPSRMVDGIKELQLRGVNSPDIHRTTGEITYQDIEAFFGPCTSRVDVILDPIQHDNHKYYPYYEGTRKMAPQFRSRGIGYVRLGDDMSNFGTAFLSVDHGRTFLDRGANDRNIMHQESYETDSRAGSASSSFGKPVADTGKKSTTTLRANTEFSRSMPLMNKNVNSQSSLPPSTTVYIPPALSIAPPPLMRATSAGTCDGSVVSYSTVPNSAMPITSQSPSPMASCQKKKLTESLRRMINVNRSQSDLQVQVPGIQTVDTSYMDDDDDATAASNGLPTPKQLLPSSPSAQQLEEAMANFESSMVQEGSSAWRVKVEVVKRLQADFELVSVQIAESVKSQTALRLLDVLREQLNRTQNPQLTIALLELLPVLASRLKVNINADSAVNLSWRRVLTEMIQLLRNNNRQIEMGANRFLVAMTQVGPRALTWPLLCDVLEPILGLPVYSALGGSASATMIGGTNSSTKQPSTGAAGSASKSLGKLNKVMEFIDQWLVSEMTTILSKGGMATTFTTEELLRLTRVALVAVKDRDEKSRTSGLQLLASIGIADVVVNSNNHNKRLPLDLSSQIAAGVSSWMQDELDRANLPRTKLTPFFAKTIESLPQSASSSNSSSNANTAEQQSNIASSSGSGKVSGGFSASLKARKLTQPSSSAMKVTNGSNPQPPSSHNASFTLVEKPRNEQQPPLGSKMMELRLQEAQLLLKKEPQSHAEWLGIQEVIELADNACTEIEHLSKQHQIPLGTVLRVLLPFTEQTSTLDQTISVVGGGDWRAQVQTDLRSQLPQLASMETEFLSYSEILRKLRGIVRVKIADQSDFRQARAAVHTLKDFLVDFTNDMT